MRKTRGESAPASYIIHFSAADSLTEGRKKEGKKKGRHDLKVLRDLKDLREPRAPACEPARKEAGSKISGGECGNRKYSLTLRKPNQTTA